VQDQRKTNKIKENLFCEMFFNACRCKIYFTRIDISILECLKITKESYICIFKFKFSF